MNSSPIALVTGGNRGLGLATATHLAAAGATVLIGARDAERGAQAAQDLRATGASAEAVQLDVTAEATVAAAANEISARYGRLDILVNNAGILPEATTPGTDQPLDLRMFTESFQTNVFGAVAVTKYFLPLLRRAEAGRIVNVSSTVGSLTEQGNPASPYYGVIAPAYQTSKAALNGLTVVLAKALADTNITVTSVCPGWVKTDLGGPDNRAAAPLQAGDAARIVAQVALDFANRDTGKFVDHAGAVAW